MKKNLFILFMSLFLGAQTFAQQALPVYYQIFVRSFADADGDGIGDIKGIISKLDYLQGLGIKGLWLTPVHPSSTYHKYDIKDYKSIDPEYGTIDDYKLLVAEAHKRGINILLDLVVNHTSSEHPWFEESVKNHATYKNYYVWRFDTLSNKNWYGNLRNPQEKYYAFFWERMPDLNFDNNLVREEVKQIGKYWLSEIGVDGFRVDAAQHVYDAEDIESNNKWWKEFGDAMKSVKPNVFIIGEVWNKDSVVATYLKSGMNSCFNFDLSKLITSAVQEGKDPGLVQRLSTIHQLYKKTEPSFVDAIFISNHDQDRYRSTFGGDEWKTKQAFAILMTLPGMPFVYYGEEIGMLGKFPDEYRREPFLWTENKKDNTFWEIPRYTNSSTVKPLSQQMNEAQSYYTYYKNMIAFRNKYPMLSLSSVVPTKLIASTNDLITYELHHAKQKVLVVHNVGKLPVELGKLASKKVLMANKLEGKKLGANGSIVIALSGL